MSDDRILEGQVWCERGKLEYRAGETAKKPRLWLVVKAPHDARTNRFAMMARKQVELVNLESGGVRRVNLRVFQQAGKNRAFELWLNTPTVQEQYEPREK